MVHNTLERLFEQVQFLRQPLKPRVHHANLQPDRGLVKKHVDEQIGPGLHISENYPTVPV